jgi:hypothetical protein
MVCMADYIRVITHPDRFSGRHLLQGLGYGMEIPHPVIDNSDVY